MAATKFSKPIDNEFTNVVYYKTATIPKNTAGTSWSPTSRNIGSIINLLGIPSDNVVSILAYNTNFSPASNPSFGMYNGNLYVSASQTCTLGSDLYLQVGYVK